MDSDDDNGGEQHGELHGEQREEDPDDEKWYEGISRMSRSEVRFLKLQGYHVWTDEEAARIRSLEEATWRPSIDEVLTPNVIQQIINGEDVDVQVPGYEEEWDGMSRETRRLLAKRLDDALLLGLHVEEVGYKEHEEADRMRKGLQTLRTLEGQLASARLSTGVAVHVAASSEGV